MLSALLFTFYTADFQNNLETCHIQKLTEDTAIVVCIREGEEGEYWTVAADFVALYDRNQLQLNVLKTGLDF